MGSPFSSRRLYVYEAPGERYTLIRGHVGAWLREQRIPAMRSPSMKGWHVRTERIADLVARAEMDGITVRIKHREAA